MDVDSLDSLARVSPASAYLPRIQSRAGIEDVWVAVSVVDRGSNQPPTEYYGTIGKDAFAILTESGRITGFLKLGHARWIEGATASNGTNGSQRAESSNGSLVPIGSAKLRYSEIYLRADTITRVILLDNRFVKEDCAPA